MKNYFTKNINKISAVISDNGYTNKLLRISYYFLIFFTLCGIANIANGVFTLILFITVFIAIIKIDYEIAKLKKLVWRYEFDSNMIEVYTTSYKNIVEYIEKNINDDYLIADPVYILDSPISEKQTFANIKNKKGFLGGSSLYSYLKSNKNWLINYNSKPRRILSPFRITAICYLEHSLVIVSQTCSLPLCSFSDISNVEMKYIGLNYKISSDNIVFGNYVSTVINKSVTARINKITTAIKPYIE